MKTANLLDAYSASPFTSDSRARQLIYLEGSVQEAASPHRQTTAKSEQIAADSTRLTQANVVSFPRFRPVEHRPTEFFAAIQEWEGVITGVHEGFFTADLYDLTAGSTEVSEIAEIAFDDIDEQDIHRVQEGAIFRWLVGHSRTRSGSSAKKWVIYFRRLSGKITQLNDLSAFHIPLEVGGFPVGDGTPERQLAT